ncbi:LPP20 family lipoprotein [Marinomonas sp. S3726]|uniref:LPP20 family lipoprotein n=1 Tax=Marinomonas sp. S3726 TaxID=579484 RepID=UPI000A041143|nr:LPP20 family lipoprotein [Marinomonas sp. S3726]
MDRKNLRNLPIRASSNMWSRSLILVSSLMLGACTELFVKSDDSSEPTQVANTNQAAPAAKASSSTLNTAAKNATPSWVLSPPSDARYLYGVGSVIQSEDLVADIKGARQQANADMANQLRVTVSQSNVQSTQVSQNTSQSEQVLKSFSSTTRMDTESLVLEQSETVENVATGKYVYVLQRLDRAKITARLRREITELDSQLEAIALEAKTQGNLVEQWQSILPALPILSERAQKLDLLQLYSTSANLASAKSETIKGLEKQLSSLLTQLSIQVSSQSARSQSLIKVLRSELTDKGLTPSSKASSPLRINLHISTNKQVKEGRTYQFVNLNASLDEVTHDSSKMLASWSLTGRGISATPEQATQSAYKKAAKSLADEVFTYLTQGNLANAQ